MGRDENPQSIEPIKSTTDEPIKKRSTFFETVKQAARDAIVRRTSSKR